MSTIREQAQAGTKRRQARALVDCDVHHELPNAAALKPYLATKHHREYGRLAGTRPDPIMLGVRPAPDIFRRDAFPPEGGPPGSSLQLLRDQLLDPCNVGRAILNPLAGLGWPTAGPLSLALTAALNDWTAAEWLDRDERLYGTIAVPVEDPARAVTEIERQAANPRFVGVLLTILTRDPLSHPKYRPLFESAAAHDLPVIVHVGGFSGAKTAAGHPQTWVESHTAWPQAYIAQAASLACSTLFDELPNLQIVLEEGGFGWLPSLIWRLERSLRLFGEDAPRQEKTPVEVIREHFWLTTQPIDEPETPGQLRALLDQLRMDDRILYASDYPHWDFDDPGRVFPPSIDAARRERFFSGNALTLFRLGADA